MQIGRRLAFDYGSTRIGVAVSDQTGIIATPVTTLQRSSSELSTQLKDLIDEYQPIYVIVGEPRHLSGASSQSMTEMSDFLELLSFLTEAPIHLIDERLSTVSAARTLRELGHNAKKSKAKIDSMAAVAILESALNKERISGSLG
jgi:putative Holliday junction resolvase